ncbi:hypothetical protein J31TS4_12460 [Paenibacillus sp. J31TS4]|uniref:hypothetical protein n=1 Tax=Paenibacillus sp. J31TS4 TaxID=2807195 RepID=UPI001B2E194C|nr:hypothetical protein [Paenibacillus sp. J31TS4]GIP37966.1 hypothetical protein J31TS4_12460 [Paenibacillus sp. J31TS4]
MRQATRTGRRVWKPAAVLLAAGVLLTAGAAPAQAGVVDRVKGFFQLPQEVDRMRDSYQEVQGQVQRSMEELEAARQAADQMAASQRQLLEENERLQQKNRELASMVDELRTSEEARREKASRIRTIVLTVAGLAAGYFLLGRLARVALRSRH